MEGGEKLSRVQLNINCVESSRKRSPSPCLHLVLQSATSLLTSCNHLATSNIDPTHSINDGNEEEDNDQIAAVALDNQCFVGLQLCKLS